MNKDYERIIERQNNMFAAVAQMTRMTAKGTNRSLIISGPPGVGKTFDVTNILKEYANQGKIQYAELKGYTRATGIYKQLYINRYPNQVLLIDDCDSALLDETSLNLLKAALDTTDERILSWNSEARLAVTLPDGTNEDVPSQFVYEGTIIFLSNLNFDDIIAKGTKISDHLAAIVSRSHYIDLAIHSNLEKLCRVVYVAIECDMLQDKYGIDRDTVYSIMKFMADNMANLREISIRTALKAGMLAASGQPNWQAMAKVTLLKQKKGEPTITKALTTSEPAGTTKPKKKRKTRSDKGKPRNPLTETQVMATAQPARERRIAA